MSEMVARCGFRCDECMAFVGNNRTHEDRVKVASGWAKYFGIEIPSEEIRCNGCWSERHTGNRLPEPSCEVNRCVVERSMNTCADCFDYPCEMIESRMEGVEGVIAKFKDKITHAEFDAYLAPYDARKTLNEIRDRRVDRID